MCVCVRACVQVREIDLLVAVSQYLMAAVPKHMLEAQELKRRLCEAVAKVRESTDQLQLV